MLRRRKTDRKRIESEEVMQTVSAWIKTLGKRMDLPGELAKDTPRLTLTGGGEVCVENPQCLLSFAPDQIELGCGRIRLRIRGSGLRLCGMDREELLIAGKILAVEVDGV